MLMLCPICAGEFSCSVSECPGCGSSLVPSSLSEDIGGLEIATDGARATEFVELCRPRAFPVAMIIKDVLERNGVVVLVHGGHALSVLPHLAFAGELRVMVTRRQADFARQLYRAYFESSDDEFGEEES